jgi:hypothetical protein
MNETSNAASQAQGRWTPESVGRLSQLELRQLRENAERAGAESVVRLCDEALAGQPKSGGRRVSEPLQRKPNLVARRTAFQMRGVNLHAGMSSWGGVRDSDGTVVFSLWADDVRRGEGGCRYLLWAPNHAGSRPWSDTAGGKERLEHCRLAQQRGRAEGLLVYGVRLEGRLPEERAETIAGVDPNVVIALRVVQQDDAYWGVWGGRKTANAF